jgi:hypothetical protein
LSNLHKEAENINDPFMCRGTMEKYGEYLPEEILLLWEISMEGDRNMQTMKISLIK